MIARKTFALLIIVLFFISVKAQDKVVTTVSKKNMSKGEQTSFSVFIPEAEPKIVENQWKRFINERSFFEFAGKGTSQTFEKAAIGIGNLFSKEKKTFDKKSLKVRKIGEELVVKNVLHEEVTTNRVDVYATIVGDTSGVTLHSYYQFSDSVFINEENLNNDVLQTLENYLRVFGEETYRLVVEKQIFEAKKELRKQENELKSLENHNKSLHKSIGKDEVDIDEFMNDIKMLENSFDEFEERIRENKSRLRAIEKGTIEYDIQKDVVKQVEKEYKKERKKIKSNKKKIKRNQTQISKARADIVINEKDQELQREVVKTHKKIVEDLERKLLSIYKQARYSYVNRISLHM